MICCVWTEVPKLWRKAGFTAAGVNAATVYAFDVADATFNARESTRRKGIDQAGYDHVVTTAEFLDLVRAVTDGDASSGPKRTAAPPSN